MVISREGSTVATGTSPRDIEMITRVAMSRKMRGITKIGGSDRRDSKISDEYTSKECRVS